MKKIDSLLSNSEFIRLIRELKRLEADRKFCKHGIEHSLDVARICHIINLEEKLDIDKEVIYAAALLHDLGRVLEYKENKTHHECGSEIARKLLLESDFSDTEADCICDAIANHKNVDTKQRNLRYLLYRADKLSRNCFLCEAYDECYWAADLKNRTVLY